MNWTEFNVNYNCCNSNIVVCCYCFCYCSKSLINMMIEFLSYIKWLYLYMGKIIHTPLLSTWCHYHFIDTTCCYCYWFLLILPFLLWLYHSNSFIVIFYMKWTEFNVNYNYCNSNIVVIVVVMVLNH